VKSFHVLATCNRGGIENLVLNLARGGLTEQTVVCSLSGPGLVGDALQRAGVEVCYCHYSTPHAARFVHALVGLFRTHRPDVVHSHVGSFTVLVALAAKLAGAKGVVATYHSTYEYSPKWRHRLYLAGGAYLTDVHVAVSRAVSRWFATEYGLHALKCVHNGVAVKPAATLAERNALRKALAIPLDAFAVVNVANSTPAKDYPTFFEVAKRLTKAVPERMFFVAIGRGTDTQPFMTTVRSYGVEHRSRLLGERADVQSLLSAMDLFLNTSRWEGLGMSLLEAQAAQLPIVASRVGGIPEAVAEGRSGMLATPGRANEYAELVLQIFRSPRLMVEMGETGRANVLEHFSIGSTVKAYRTIYDGLAGVGAPRGRGPRETDAELPPARPGAPPVAGNLCMATNPSALEPGAKR